LSDPRLAEALVGVIPSGSVAAKVTSLPSGGVVPTFVILTTYFSVPPVGTVVFDTDVRPNVRALDALAAQHSRTAATTLAAHVARRRRYAGIRLIGIDLTVRSSHAARGYASHVCALCGGRICAFL
jgi:hypothetical protein